ncbi:hypothetical protein MPDQ_003498 [Monascus purpureus]|uniref:Uncharacterized protein n=1 Tax=Monascus purpureus TaxID=5098 RepID=A0A507R1J5_MONPU|nr:hypothetical protein MPDQ_003498 [Monascus purpureus]
MATTTQRIRTPVTDLLGIKHPVLLAGIFAVSSPRMAAASYLVDKNAPFGVDLLIPRVGGNARKSNYDYTDSKLDELIQKIVESGVRLFVSAVGLPPKGVVDALHKGGMLYMNMVGHPSHAQKAIENGADLLCAQGGEAGGHTGEIPIVILVPAVSKIINHQKSTITGKEVQLVAADGLFNGQSLAATLMLGASAVWIGTQFTLVDESGAPPYLQEALRKASFGDIIRTTIFTGRPLHARSSPYIRRWEEGRRQEKLDLQSKDIIPIQHELKTKPDDKEVNENAHPVLMGKVAGMVSEKSPAKKIIDDMVDEASALLIKGQKLVLTPKL